MKRFVVVLLIVVTLAGAGYSAYALGYLPAAITQVLAAPAASSAQSAPQSVEAQAVAQPLSLIHI